MLKKSAGRSDAKEVGMGDPAEVNDRAARRPESDRPAGELQGFLALGAGAVRPNLTRPPRSPQRLPRQKRRVLPGGKRAQAEAVAVFVAGNEKWLVRPGAPTVVAADALLLEVQVQGDLIPVRQLEGVLAGVQILGAVMQRVGAEQRQADREDGQHAVWPLARASQRTSALLPLSPGLV